MRHLLFASILFLLFCGCSGLDPSDRAKLNPFSISRNKAVVKNHPPTQDWVAWRNVQLGNNRNFVLMSYRQGQITKEEWWAWQESRGEKLTELHNGFERDSRVAKRQDHDNFSSFAWAVFEAMQPWSAKHKIK
tara:strand:+ start:98 stop:496 length:399 start_codon:yes stop_codon:yes gene_type:complete